MLCDKKCPAVTAGLVALLVTSPTTAQAATNGASGQELLMLTIPPFIIGCATGAVAGAIVGHMAARAAVRAEIAGFETRLRVQAAKLADKKKAEQAAKPQANAQNQHPRHARTQDWEQTGNIRVQKLSSGEEAYKLEEAPRHAAVKTAQAVETKPKLAKKSEPKKGTVQEVAQVSAPAAPKNRSANPEAGVREPAQVETNDYEQVAENYVERMSFRELMATRARGVAAVLADRLGSKDDGIPIIERADGSTGDLGAVWWGHTLGGRMHSATVSAQKAKPVSAPAAAAATPVVAPAAPAASAPTQIEGPAAVATAAEGVEPAQAEQERDISQDTTNSLKISAAHVRSAKDKLHYGDTSGAMPVLEATGAMPHTGAIRIPAHFGEIANPADQSLSFMMSPAFENLRAAAIDLDTEELLRTPEEAAEERVNRIKSPSVEDIVSRILAEERQAMGVDEERTSRALEEADRARREREALEARKAQKAATKQAEEARIAAFASVPASEFNVDEYLAELEADYRMQRDPSSKHMQATVAPTSPVVEELIEEKAHEVVFPEVRDDTDPGMHVDIWKLALDALEERTSTDLRDASFAFMDSVGDADSIDDPDGLEASTAFLAFRRPAGHPEVMDTNSYVNYLLEKEFESASSESAKDSSHEYLKLIDGGSNKAQALVDPRARRSAKYRPSHFTEAQEA